MTLNPTHSTHPYLGTPAGGLEDRRAGLPSSWLEEMQEADRILGVRWMDERTYHMATQHHAKKRCDGCYPHFAHASGKCDDFGKHCGCWFGARP